MVASTCTSECSKCDELEKNSLKLEIGKKEREGERGGREREKERESEREQERARERERERDREREIERERERERERGIERQRDYITVYVCNHNLVDRPFGSNADSNPSKLG